MTLDQLVSAQRYAGRLLNAHHSLAISVDASTVALYWEMTDIITRELERAPRERIAAMADAWTVCMRALHASFTLATKRRFAS